MNSNVTPIHNGIPIIEARPEVTEATPEELAAFTPVQDFCLVRVVDVFAAAGLVRPENISLESAAKMNQGLIVRSGPDVATPLGTKVQWRANAHKEPVKVGPELMLCVRERDFLAVLSAPIVDGEK